MDKKSLGFLLVPLLFVIPNLAYSTPLFGGPTPLDSADPFGGSQVAVSGSKVFSIWTDACNDIIYSRSINDGLSFTNGAHPIIGSDGACTFLLGFQRVAAAGSNVYIVYDDSGSTPGIFVLRSGTSGLNFQGVSFTGPTFPPPSILISPDRPSTNLEISASGNFLYVVWNDSITGQIKMAASDNKGMTFSLSTLSSDSSSTPVVASSGSDAFVSWVDSTGNVIVKKVTNTGGVFDFTITPQNLSITGTASDTKIAATSSGVYVAWIDSLPQHEIYFSSSTDGGVTFNGGTAGAPVNLSGNTGDSVLPDIAATGNNVYVVWKDNQFSTSLNYEILLQSSSDKGATFNGGTAGALGVPVNLSGNSGESSSPQISAFGSEAYVVWQDSTFDSDDILFRTILNNGNTIGGIKNISQPIGKSELPQVASSSTNVSVIWDDTPVTAVSFNHATTNTVDVSLDKTEYLVGDAATITVIDTPGSVTLSVDVNKNGAFEFSTPPLTEGPAGVYTGTISFISGPTVGPSGILGVAPGDLIKITAPPSGQTTFASIVSSGAISFTPVTLAYDRGAIAHVTVTDASANTNPAVAESVTVDVTSTTQVGSTPLTLHETGPNTGIFGNTANNKLIFITSNDNKWPENSEITITQQHLSADITPGVDTISETILSTSYPAGITLPLTETGGSTGIFTGVLTISSVGPTAGSTILAPPGDIVQVIRGSIKSNALVTSSTDNVAAVLVNSDPLTDTVTVSYDGSSAKADVEQQYASGGGAGGISRAGLVVNALGFVKTLGGGGGSNGNSPPSFGTSSFAIIEGGEEGFGGILNDNDATTLDQTKTFKVGEKAVLRFDYTEGGGIGKIEHIGLYANVRDGQKRQDSDAYIFYDPLKSPQVTVHDPNGLFSEANFELLQKDTASNFVLKFDLTFAKPMAKSDLILESWNIKKWSSITKISNAIEVMPSGILQETQSAEPAKTFLEDVTDDKVIPVWVKTNAKWWSAGTIDNENFISGIEYLVNEGIISVSLTAGTDDSISEMPSWIKSTAGWWADDMISEDEFVTAIEWLITNNIIQVAA